MIINPIQNVSDKFQNRAIGIVYGTYKPIEPLLFHKGVIKDKNGYELDAVVLGKVIPLIKKYVDIKKEYFWVVYPRNNNLSNLHLQIAGIWDPDDFKSNDEKSSEAKHKLLKTLNLKDNLFSVRGKLIFINMEEKEIIIKICSSKTKQNNKNKSFKINISGEIPMEFINEFVSLTISRKNNTLCLDDFEIISTNNQPKKFLNKK